MGVLGILLTPREPIDDWAGERNIPKFQAPGVEPVSTSLLQPDLDVTCKDLGTARASSEAGSFRYSMMGTSVPDDGG